MDQSEQSQQQVVGSAGHMAYATPPFHAAPVVVTGTPAAAVSSPTQLPPISTSQQQLAYHQAQHFHHQQQQQQQQQQLQAFWANQKQEIEQTTDFKNHSLPLARIKKIMKADEDVRMISAEAPVIFAKACEMFILELTLRSWIHTEENKRRTLQKNDIAAAISRTDVFDFLVDIIPRDELKEEGLGVTKATIPLVGSPGDSIPYYYVPQQQQVGQPGMICWENQLIKQCFMLVSSLRHLCHGLSLLNNKTISSKMANDRVETTVFIGVIITFIGWPR